MYTFRYWISGILFKIKVQTLGFQYVKAIFLKSCLIYDRFLHKYFTGKETTIPAQMAVVYTNSDGYLSYFGSANLTKIITEHGQLFQEAAYGKAGSTYLPPQPFLPKLRTAIHNMDIHTLMKIIPASMKAVNAKQDRQIHWGVSQYRPAWWPSHIPFQNIKQKPKDKQMG